MDGGTRSEDAEAIRDLLHHYSFCVDSRRPGRLDEVFAESVEARYGYGEDGVWHGVAAVIDGIEGLLAPLAGTAHMLSNVRVEATGDAATSSAYVSAWHWVEAPGGPTERPADFLFTCAYLDDLERREEGWRIVRRRLRRLGPTALTAGTMPDHMRPAEAGR